MRFVSLASFAVLLATLTLNTSRAQPPARVVITPVVQREVSASQPFVATVLPSKLAIIGSAIDGRVVEFPLNQGERVEQGQALAQLLTETIQLELKAARAELEIRRQELAELENGTRPEELEQAEARMLAAEAKKEYLTARRLRTESLFDGGRAISEQQRDEAVSAAIEAEQQYADAKAAHDLAVAGPRTERIAQARAQVAKQDALVEQLTDRIRKHTVISRLDGYVTAEHTEVGSWVKQGDPVAEVAALDVVEVLAYVVEKHVPHIGVGMEVRVDVAAFPDRVFTGKVVQIVPQADIRARTFPVRVRVENEVNSRGPLLKSGMTARAVLPTGEQRQAPLVPKDALVLSTQAPPVVYVVEMESPRAPKGTVRPVTVELGVAAHGLIEVIGSLRPDQWVVVQGNERLRPGQEVIIAARRQPDAVPEPTPPT